MIRLRRWLLVSPEASAGMAERVMPLLSPSTCLRWCTSSWTIVSFFNPPLSLLRAMVLPEWLPSVRPSMGRTSISISPLPTSFRLSATEGMASSTRSRTRASWPGRQWTAIISWILFASPLRAPVLRRAGPRTSIPSMSYPSVSANQGAACLGVIL